MSSVKRTRQRQSEAGAAASLPPAKKARTAHDQPATQPGLEFLTNDKQRAGKTIKAKLTNGTVDVAQHRPDESTAVIHTQTAAAGEEDDQIQDEGANGLDEDSSEVSDSSDDINSEDDDEEMTDAPHLQQTKNKALTNGTTAHVKETNADVDLVNGPQALAVAPSISKAAAPDTEEGIEEQEAGPTFGDLVQAAYPEAIDVQASFAERNPEAKALVPTDNSRNLQAPSATSLGTVLTQALRTNDKELLESCLQTKDVASIQSTIQRLQSPLVANLLQRLAERLHKRPGRAGPLMTWIQWSLVAHGGYLAGQPQITRKLKALHQVVRERANSLQSLMTLKGKLDMLNAQIELRRNMQAQRTVEDESDEDDAAVIYVEGEENDSYDDTSDADDTAPTLKAKIPDRRRKSREPETDIVPSDDDDDAVMVNGVDEEVEEESESGEDEEQDGEGLIDDIAEETSDDDGDDATSEEDDSAEDLEDEEEDDDDISASEEEVPPAKQVKQTRSSLARRR